jgi:hypothetical protein
MQKKYCSGTRKAMHVMQFSKPEMYNAVQDLSCHMHEACRITTRPCCMYLSTVWTPFIRD